MKAIVVCLHYIERGIHLACPMVKLIGKMNSTNLKILPAPPSLMKSLMAGFDAISNQFGLVIFTLALDLFLWLGPRLTIARIFEDILAQQAGGLPETTNAEVLERLRLLVGEFNLFSVLRTFPIGVPSLVASRSAVESPLGKSVFWEVSSLGAAFGVWALLVILGACLGAFYFTAVSQAALVGEVNWQVVLARWPWTSLQTLLLMALWLMMIFAASLLFGCTLTFLLLSGGLGLEQVTLFGLLVFAGILIWALIPLMFSPHGLFVSKNTVWSSIKNSARLTRMTLPTTVMLFLAIIIISEGLRLVWNIPSITSWWMLVGIIGHAFITTSLLAASFIYYHDADRWLRGMLRRAQQPLA